MLSRKGWHTKLITLHCLGFIFGCSQENLQDEAVSILSEDEINPDGPIEKSADGLQFTQEKTQVNHETTVGFTNKGDLSYKGDFKNGQPHGLWTTYFPDGKPRWKGYKKEGTNHGPFTMWYESGKKRIEGMYENGLKHGQSIAWHPNGSKWQQKSHHHGNPVGIWKTWDENGNLISEIFHDSPGEMNASHSLLD